MPFQVKFTTEANAQYVEIEQSDSQKIKKVNRAIARLEQDPWHPALHAHRFNSLQGPNGEQMWTAYVETAVPNAYRILFFFPEGTKGQISIAYVGPHY